jgi:hypothetical protein
MLEVKENSKLYVGTREPRSSFQNLLNRDIYHLNEGLSKKLRTSVMKKGIKKTEQGKKLMFFSVSGSEYQNLIESKLDVLVKVDEHSLSNKLKEINSNYPRRMDLNLSQKYKVELEKGFLDSIEVVGNDKNIRKKPTKSNYLSGNSKLGKLIYNTDGRKMFLGEVEEFFNWMFHNEYVIDFSYRKDHSNLDLEEYGWKNTQQITKEVFDKYEKSYRLLTKWSYLGGYSEMRIYLFEHNGEFSISNGYSYDGFSNDVSITTSKHITELFKEFENELVYDGEFTDSLMNNYSHYGSWGFFKNYDPITWKECKEVYGNIFVPIIKESEGKDGFYGYDTLNRERMRDILLSKRGKNWMELEHGLWVKKYYLKEDVSKQDIVDIWWNDKKSWMLRGKPNLTKQELDKERVEFDKLSWSSESRLEEIYENFKN